MKKSVLIFIIILSFALKNHTKTAQKIYAIYNPPANRKAHKVLKRMGINTVFIKTDYKAAVFFKKRRYKVYISFPVFFNRHMLKVYPGLHAIDKNGHPLPKISWYRGINPGVRWYRNLQLRKLRYIIKGYKIDGIALDFIRYPVHWEPKNKLLADSSFDVHTLKQFQKYINKTIPFPLKKTRLVCRWIYSNHRKDWTKFKCKIISGFISQVKKIIKANNRKIKLGVFMIPWNNDDYLGAIKTIAAQDIDLIRKPADFISPMLYHKMLGNNIQWFEKTLRYFVRKNHSKNILPILQGFNIKPSEILKAMRISNTLPGSSGFIIFGYKHLNFTKKRAIARYITGR